MCTCTCLYIDIEVCMYVYIHTYNIYIYICTVLRIYMSYKYINIDHISTWCTWSSRQPRGIQLSDTVLDPGATDGIRWKRG